MFKALSAALYLRRIARDLGKIALALDAQTAVLLRVADHFAPQLAAPDRKTLASDTGVSHLDPLDASLALDYVTRTARDTGHVPDDDEVLIYLADEKTTDLHKRLAQRDDELSRLMEARR